MRDAGVWTRPAFLAAIALFLAQGLALAWTTPCWHEEVSAHVEPAVRLATAGPDGAPIVEPSCRDASPAHLLRSPIRPTLALCLGGTSFPVMINAYSSGLLHWPLALAWPLHRGNPFLLRATGVVLLGLWALFLVHRIAARIEDELTGDLSALALAVSTQFTSSYAMLVHYELFPALLLGTATLLSIRSGPPAGWTGRAGAAAGALIGLALVSNVKAVLLGVPLLLLLRTPNGIRSTPGRAISFAALGASLPIAFFVIVSAADPGHGVAMQVSTRLATLLSHLEAERFAREALNVLVYWSDLTYYAELIVHRDPAPNWPGVVVAALALGYGTLALVRVLRTGDGPWLAAISAAAILFFVGVSVLLYEQQPAANYSPIHAVFGWATGTALAAMHRALRDRRPAALALGFAALAAFGWVAVARGGLLGRLPLPINAAAERALATHLRAHPEGLVVTTLYNHTGVFEAIGVGGADLLALHAYLGSCPTPEPDADGSRACLEARFDALLAQTDRPLRAVVAARPAVIDEPWSMLAEPALRAAADRRGLRASTELEVSAESGEVVLRLIRVER
jgi:hypothetical protein